MSGRSVLITGASRGLGRRTAGLLCERGWLVLLGCRDVAAGEAVARDLRERGGAAAVVPLDVTDARSIGEAGDIVEELGGGRLDALVNNAGVFNHVADEGFETITAEACEEIFAVNALGPVLVTQALLPLLCAADGAAIVNVSSDDGDPATADGECTCYRMSKAALNMLTLNLAVAMKPSGVVVNAVYPGWLPTDMGGPDAPDDLDESAALVASVAELAGTDRRGAPTGQIFAIGAPPRSLAPA